VSKQDFRDYRIGGTVGHSSMWVRHFRGWNFVWFNVESDHGMTRIDLKRAEMIALKRALACALKRMGKKGAK